MRFLTFINDNIHAFFLTLLLVIATACWFAAPAPRPPKAFVAATEPWSLPALPAADGGKAIQTINTRNPWGVAAAAGANAPPPPPKWSVMGIARNGAERSIMLVYEGKPIEARKVGDALPDGAQIAQINDDHFFVITPDKKKTAFGIYKNAPTQ